jgi:flagellar basal body-associated protein FliL
MSEHGQLQISVLISLLSISILASVFTISMAFSQENAIFSVSPGSFTASKVPPLGTPYKIPQDIVVWNHDNTDRVVLITSEIPPVNEITPGYQPIPNENWVRPLSSSILIKADNYAVIQLSFNIPRQENLTGQKWEVWIPVEREALPGEIGVLRPTVRVKIETTAQLPALGNRASLALLAVGIVIAVAVICIGVWFYSKRGTEKPRKGVISRR